MRFGFCILLCHVGPVGVGCSIFLKRGVSGQHIITTVPTTVQYQESPAEPVGGWQKIERERVREREQLEKIVWSGCE